MLKITGHKGFQMTFANGWTVSVQFGPGDYCNCKRWAPHTRGAPEMAGMWESPDAEVACWDKAGNFQRPPWLDWPNDDVRGWLSADKVAEFIDWVVRQ